MRKTVSVVLIVLLMLLLCFTALAAENENGFSAGELPANGEEDVLIYPAEAMPIPESAAAQLAPEESGVSPGEGSASEPQSAPQASDKSAPAAQPEENAPESSGQTNVPVVIAVVALVLAVGMIPVMLLRKNRRAAKDD